MKCVLAWSVAAAAALAAVAAQDLQPGKVLLADNFERFTTATTELGTLPGTEHHWVKRIPAVNGQPAEGLITGAEGAVRVAYSSGSDPRDTGLAVGGFTLADGVISLLVGPSFMADRGHTAIVTYRARDESAAAGGMTEAGYHVEMAGDWSGSRDVVLRYGGERLAVADVGPVLDPASSHRLQVGFLGDHHQVRLDDRLVIDAWESSAGRTAAGYLGFGGYYSAGSFDDVQIATVSAAPATPTDRRGQLRPLLFQGRPFFVLGTFDPPHDEDLAEWLEAGCNTTLFHVLDPHADSAQRQAQLQQDIAWARPHNTALIYFPILDFYGHTAASPLPTPAETVPLIAQIKEMLQVTATDPQTLGYWTFDEPENHLYTAYAEWETRRDQGLGEWMAGGFQWLYDTLKAGDPDAYVMPTLGWWTTYAAAAAMYDVNVPNEYPQRGAPLSGDLYNAVYDAAQAADAARAQGRTGFVYMPPCFDVIEEPWRGATLAEFRYLCFGPLTQGAQGLLPWRLHRATLPYRRAVIYPVYRQIKPLIPWLLGERCDERVTSSADAPSVAYLKQFPLRVRTVAGEAAAEKVEVPGLGDCSHCLRRRPDNTYLLLAVNNRREALEVTFTLNGLGELPATALETLEYARTPISAGQITASFAPFAVRAWIIEPK